MSLQEAKCTLKDQLKRIAAKSKEAEYCGDVDGIPVLETPPASMAKVEKALDSTLTPAPIGIQTVPCLTSLIFPHFCLHVQQFIFKV